MVTSREPRLPPKHPKSTVLYLASRFRLASPSNPKASSTDLQQPALPTLRFRLQAPFIRPYTLRPLLLLFFFFSFFFSFFFPQLRLLLLSPFLIPSPPLPTPPPHSSPLLSPDDCRLPSSLAAAYVGACSPRPSRHHVCIEAGSRQPSLILQLSSAITPFTPCEAASNPTKLPLALPSVRPRCCLYAPRYCRRGHGRGPSRQFHLPRHPNCSLSFPSRFCLCALAARPPKWHFSARQRRRHHARTPPVGCCLTSKILSRGCLAHSGLSHLLPRVSARAASRRAVCPIPSN